MTKDSQVVNDSRIAWVVAVLGLVAGAAMAFGFSTPADRLSKVEKRVDDHDTRIQRLEDTKETIEAIAKAVGAPIKRSGHP